MESQYNEPLCNEVLDLTKIFFPPVILKYIKKNLNTTKPHYSKHILPVPWPFLKSVFHSIAGFSLINSVAKAVCFWDSFVGLLLFMGMIFLSFGGSGALLKLNNVLVLCYKVFAIDFNSLSPNGDQLQISLNYTSARSKRTGKENEWNDQHLLNVLMFEQILL